MIDLDQIKNIHFIGIGGAGMSALANVLIKRGFHVSGSDAKPGDMATKLAKEGALVFIGHAACQIERAEVIVVSTAIHPDNPELVEAHKRGVPVIHRSDVLAYLMNKHKGIAVAGAHGKTTTSSMLSLITCDNGVDPTVVVGGVVNNLGTNSVNGKSDYVVAEADESVGPSLSFVLIWLSLQILKMTIWTIMERKKRSRKPSSSLSIKSRNKAKPFFAMIMKRCAASGKDRDRGHQLWH